MAGALADLFVGLLRAVPDADGGSDLVVVEAASKGDLDKLKIIIAKDASKVHMSKFVL